jgi:hypothetical protein
MKLRKQFAVPAGIIVRMGPVWGGRGHMLRSRIRAKYDDLRYAIKFLVPKLNSDGLVMTRWIFWVNISVGESKAELVWGALRRTAMRVKAIKMRRLLAASALMVFATVVPGSAEAVPTLNLDAICRGIAAHATSPGEAGGPDLSFRQCINQELRIRNRLTKSWTTFSAKSKAECVGEATAGGLASYTDLLTCLQLTRDVEQMRHQKR